MSLIVSGWNNGSPNNETGAGYGIRISKKDRDKYFRREWEFVEIELEDDEVITVRLSSSFWKDCSELRSSKIGMWMLQKGYAPWPKNNPPKFELIPVSERRFRLLPLL
ncbi:hypothetical protein DRP04_05000 [Archaeoglobales archaeon]|nr:MAG: hypothetical protein DRP04_05000 [Archaeoglobales archaeon]